MKACPNCGTRYSDDLNFCLQDGAPLRTVPTSELANQPTEQFRGDTLPQTDISDLRTVPFAPAATQPPKPTRQYRFAAVDPASRMGCIVTVGQVSLGLILVAGLGMAGLYYTSFNTGQVARNEPTYATNTSSPPDYTSAANANTAPASRSNTVVPRPTPAASRTPPPDPAKAANRTPEPPVKTAATPSPALPAKTAPSKTVQGGVLNGKALSLPKPPYPPAARAVNASGAVVVSVLIGEDGRVISASAVSGHPLLRAAAVSAARQARFSPTLLSGEPVKVSGVITYNFVP